MLNREIMLNRAKDYHYKERLKERNDKEGKE